MRRSLLFDVGRTAIDHHGCKTTMKDLSSSSISVGTSPAMTHPLRLNQMSALSASRWYPSASRAD